MRLLDLDALAAEPLMREPYDYLVLKNFVRAEAAASVGADYPTVSKAGSFALEDVTVKGAFADLIEELNGEGFRVAIEAKFGMSLAGLPTTFTVRGMCGAHDGQIHTDSKTKVITVLLYLNEAWAEDGGRLRLLRNGEDLDAVAAETPPDFGTLLLFRRSETSWHGHKPTSGPRRAIQLNWVTNQAVVDHEQGRHRISTKLKKFRNLFIPSSAA